MSDLFTPAILDFIAEQRELKTSLPNIRKAIRQKFGIEVSESGIYWQCMVEGIERPDCKPLPQTAPGPLVYKRGKQQVRRFTPAEDKEILTRIKRKESKASIGRLLGRPHNSITARLVTLARHEARSEIATTSTTGGGKAQPHTSHVLTPDGWRYMGDLKAGDMVTVPDGGSAEILKVFPHGEILVYRVTFADGREVECCGDHLWEVYKAGSDDEAWSGPFIVNTMEIQRSLSSEPGSFAIRLVKPIDFTQVSVPDDPYIMGCKLCDHLELDGEELVDGSLFVASFPEIIKRASAAQRLAFLQGVMDRHGGNDLESPGYLSCLSHAPESIADDLTDLARSLGCIAQKMSDGGGFRIRLQHPMPESLIIDQGWKELFRCKKQDPETCCSRCENRRIERGLCFDGEALIIELKLGIVSVESAGRIEESSCILIDHPDHLYVTDGYTVTHNTQVLMGLNQK